MFKAIFSRLLIWIGFVCFVVPVFFSLRLLPIGDDVELPNKDIVDFELLPSGQLYIASSFWGRIQLYSSDGEFLRGWTAFSTGHEYCLESDDGELVLLSNGRQGMKILNLDGDPLAPALAQAREGRTETGRSPCENSANILSTDIGWDSIEIMTASPQFPEISIRREWWHGIILGPFLSWCLLVSGLILNPKTSVKLAEALQQAKKMWGDVVRGI